MHVDLGALFQGFVLQETVNAVGRDGAVDSVLVDIGGFLGLGERRIAVDMQAILVELRVVPEHVAQAGAGLLHRTGLAHPGMVEANERRLLGAVAEGELLGGVHIVAQPRGQVLEVLQRGGGHQASPPNTSIWLNTQAGEAWPTRTTWLGSPLPQLGVPSTWKVLASPTALRLRQKPAEMPR